MFKIDTKLLVQLALIGGIVYLASHDMEGWGWLTAVLFLTLG